MSLKTSYTLIAPIYDAFVKAPLERARAESLKGLPTSPSGTVLLNGVGTGLDLPHLPDAHDYVGVDLTPAMLRRAARVPLQRRVSFVQGDAMRLPFGDASFDHAVLHLILAIVPDPTACLRETARVVRSGGTVLVFDKFLRLRQRAWLRRALTPITGAVATRLDVVFENVLGQVPGLEVESDAGFAGKWFRLIRLRRA
ncbi:MAG: class I SAM-dependent methyltransferase [Burkholderiales bacterium]|jgi:ubiquinone/menaquinone biosynthesis C-methylase UbiE|nr:class I SAM-dependent methyltransferase [Burkholderiales bacterium]